MDQKNQNIGNNQNTSRSDALNELTQERATESNAIEIPSISLPKGGGALKGIDEKFEVNSANGTAGFSIPLPLSPGRNGFNPSLSLSYNSGGGNGSYGLGWSIGYLMIQRKTDKRLPRYRDGLEEDTFMFSGAEDLVPFMEENNGEWKEKDYPNNGAGGYTVKRYRPRIEGGFARIEKIHHLDHGIYWKVTTRENIATIFGRSTNARIANSDDTTQIFQWMPEFSYDDKGNWIKYEYKKEDLVNVPNYVYEKNRRAEIASFTNTYLKKVKYGNQTAYYADPTNPYDPQSPAEDAIHFFELIMDYGEHDVLNPTPQDNGQWEYRPDAFSSYRSGFEIRTNRLCKRILMFHHFKDEKQFHGLKEDGKPLSSSFGKNYLVRSLDLKYEASSINQSNQSEVTYLKSVVQSGYIRKPDDSYSRKSLPPLEFTYQKLDWNKNIKTVSKEAIVNAPVGLTNNYQWVDLYGEGISGILTEQAEGLYYKSNLGVNFLKNEVSFSVSEQVMNKPSFGGLSLQDLDSNGEKQFVVNGPGMNGYFEQKVDKIWKPFKAFNKVVNVNLQDPNTRMIDLNGDGRPDLVITEENAFIWYASDGKKGHLSAQIASKSLDEEKGPSIVFADQLQTIFLADMAGDGLTDIVRIRSGEICYWANMGYGKFSAKVTMDNAPYFDNCDIFNPQYIHLADVSGTGATDIIYLGKNKFKAYINLSGNAWSDAHVIDPFLPIDGNSKLSVVDLLGTGTSCIVWSSDLPAYTNAPMRYIDLMDSKKPHVMIHYKNNMGAETSMEYKSSTHYYLSDKLEGRPWITKLPFPVQVVSKIIIEEKITNVRFATEYKYHHGYYDHPEREFRGFGMVEQLDSEFYETWKEHNDGNVLDQSGDLFQAPMLTKIWYHTGAFLDRERILTHFKREYWHEEFNRKFPTKPIHISEPELKDGQLSDEIRATHVDEYREALRACKGMMLRQEVFALDAPDTPTIAELQLQMKPFTVATHNCNIQILQPRAGNKFGVFLVTESERIQIHYERDETDYRLVHTLNTKIDDLGNILESASVVYGRDQAKAEIDFLMLSTNNTDYSEDVLENNLAQKIQLQNAFDNNILAAKNEQPKTHIIYTQNSFAKYKLGTTLFDDLDIPHAYRLRIPHETLTFEITDIEKNLEGEIIKYNEPQNSKFELFEVAELFTQAASIEYHTKADRGKEKRLIEHVKTKYLNNNLEPLDFELYDILGLPCESYQLAYTHDLVNDIYSNDGTLLEANNQVVNDLIGTKGNYSDLDLDGKMWIRSGIVHFKKDNEDIDKVKQRFFSPIMFESPFGLKTFVRYDIEKFNEDGMRKNDGYYLFIRDTEDELKNKSQIDIFNYRTLSPCRMIDINANPSSILMDELGLVKAIALEGNGKYVDKTRTTVELHELADNLRGMKEYEEFEGEDINAMNQLLSKSTFNSTDTAQLRIDGKGLLKNATSRFVYDVSRYVSSGKNPTVISSIIREEHAQVNPNSAIQFSFEYSDGGGNVVMTKTQAEPGKAFFMEDGILKSKATDPDLRWIGNGRTILNNKGNPVKQYEPYFSPHFSYEDDPEIVEIGVTPIIYYDAPGRVIKTQFPDGTLSRVEFDSWKQVSFDQNDTVLESQWYIDRGSPDPSTENEPLNDQNRRAAWLAAQHANTPSSVYLDSLGRPVLSIEHNGKDNQGKNRLYTTYINLDIEGNTRNVIDARSNDVMSYKYDMLGHRVYQKSMDAGQRWMFNDLGGKPVFSWDERNHLFEYRYDSFQRPTHSIVHGGDAEDGFVLSNIFNRNFYGENEQDAELKNLRGQIIRMYDTGGLIETLEYDFKGQPKSTQRTLFKHYKNVVDWTDDKLMDDLEEDIFVFTTLTDALGRIIEQVTPDGSIIVPGYSERGILNGESVKHIDPDTTTTYIEDIDYNEKGQRNKIVYGNKVTTNFEYDEKTFKLMHLESRRKDGSLLQDLIYTYDPAGNITHIEDKVNPVVFFKNQKISANSSYVYDAIYRLVKADGRENDKGHAFGNLDNTHDKAFLHELAQNDAMKMREYTQHYLYDPVGNIDQMRHQVTTGNGWRRNYKYETNNNRLRSTNLGDGVNQTYNYTHHARHGYISKMPHLKTMQWNFKEELVKTVCQKINDDSSPITTYYQYDGNGQRIRKITDNKAAGNTTATKKEERIYLDGYELYIKHTGKNKGLKRRTLSLMDEDHRFVMIESRNEVDDNTANFLVRYQLHNHLGSASLELDAREEVRVISYEEYHPYGTTAYQAKNKAIRSVAKRYRYTGMERDEECGLSYHSARYYLPWLGRWLSGDPIGIGDGVNLYRYGRSNPIKLVDLSGTNSKLGLSIDQCTTDNPDGQVFKMPTKKEIQENFEKHLKSHPLSNVDNIPALFVDSAGRGRIMTKTEYSQGHKLGRYGDTKDIKAFLIVAGVSLLGAAALNVTPYEAFTYLAAGETIADAAQTGIAVGDAIREPSGPNLAAAGVSALDTLSLIPSRAAEYMTANRNDRINNSSRIDPNIQEVPDVFLHEIVPVRNITKQGEKRQPQAPKEGQYRGVTKKNRDEVKRIGEKYGGPGTYDVGHRVPLSQIEPGHPVRFKAENHIKNRKAGSAIAKSNRSRRKAGLYVRPTISKKKRKK